MSRIALVGFLVLGVVHLATTPAVAGPIFAEVGDAGSTIAGAQPATDGTSNPLTSITGTITPAGDADVFRIYISDPAAFSATTVGQPGTLGDTQLFLFSDLGFGIYHNDDASSDGTLRSTLPAGNSLSPTAAGYYLLGISAWDIDPTSSGGLIFPNIISTSIFGPTGPGGASPLVGFSPQSSQGGTGTYTIQLTGVTNGPQQTDPDPNPNPNPTPSPVPEPSSLALFVLVGAIGFAFGRRPLRT